MFEGLRLSLAESIRFFCDLDVMPVRIRTMRARNRDPEFQTSATSILRSIAGDGRNGRHALKIRNCSGVGVFE